MQKRIRLPRFRILNAKYGNSLGFLVNRRWRKYHQDCILHYCDWHQGDQQKIVSIETNGFAKIEQIDCMSLAEKIDNEFRVLKSMELSTTLPQSLAGNFAYDVYEVLKQLTPTVEGFFGCHFQPYWIQFQRTIPGQVSAASAFGWHIDDNPKEIMKIFVYLNDVREANGAFRAIDRIGTGKLLKSGFRSWSQKNRLRSQLMVEKYLYLDPDRVKILEGEPGTCLIFDNNLVHKGTPPVSGYRHVIQIEVYPSMYPLRFEDVEAAITSPFGSDYPTDPYHNDFGGNQ